MLNSKIRLKYSLSSSSKRILYNALSFYDLSSFARKFLNKKQKNVTSFKKILLTKSNSIQLVNNNKFILARAKTLCINNSFLYLDLGRKFNLVKPKVKISLKNLLNKEFLFFLQKTFFQFRPFFKVKHILQIFQYKYIRSKNPAFTVDNFCLESLARLYWIKKSIRFFFIKLRKSFFSNYQKKINFCQFHILFKKV